MVLDLVQLQLQTCLPGKDQDLPRHIYPTEIDLRVRLCIPLLHGGFHNLIKWDFTFIVVENKIQASRKHSLDLMDAVSRRYKIFKGIYNGKSGPYIGLIQEAGSKLTGQVLQLGE